MIPDPIAGPAAASARVRRIRIALLVTTAVLAAADLALKAVAEAVLSTGAVFDLGVVSVRLVYNPGVAFSLGADLAPWIIIAATSLIIMTMTWYAISAAPNMTRLPRAGAALLLGGAAGNLFDRIDGRGVVDYLHTGWFPTFNLADIFVTMGVALYIWGTLIRSRPRSGT